MPNFVVVVLTVRIKRPHAFGFTTPKSFTSVRPRDYNSANYCDYDDANYVDGNSSFIPIVIRWIARISCVGDGENVEMFRCRLP